MLKTVQGIYKDGKIQLAEIPNGIHESTVLVTFLENKTRTWSNISTTTELITYWLFTNSLPVKDFSPDFCVINFVQLLNFATSRFCRQY